MNANPLCYICSAKTFFFMKKDGFDEYLCPTCGVSFTFPQPAEEWLKTEIYSAESGYQGNKKMDLSTLEPGVRYGSTLDFITREKKGGALLDVGCSSGQFMFWSRERGFACKGVELNKRTAELARQNGFEVWDSFLSSAPFEKHSFDVVYLGDVIEHVNDPNALVREAALFLKEDGIIAISTPNVDCFWSKATLLLYKVFGIPWSSVTPPHHLFQFSFSNLNLVLQKNGMKLVHSIFTKPASLKYELGSLHLFGAFKRNKNLFSLVRMIIGFSSYAIIYGINTILHPFLLKDFQMVTFYKKNYE